MQTSEFHSKNFILLYAALLGTAAVLTWFSQKSINAYWQQTYHQTGILEPLDQFEWWRSGAAAQEWLNGTYQNALDRFAEQSSAWIRYAEQFEAGGRQEETVQPSAAGGITAESPANGALQTASHGSEKEVRQEAFSAEVQVAEQADEVVLRSGDKVFFAGDSLMQGVAPFAQKYLSSSYGIASLNLSKQSTGLSYPGFFDWPATIEKNLKEDSAIKLLVVFLGPNDPWDFADPANKGRILKFATPEWEEVYRSRVQRIVQSAQNAGAKIIWLGIPYMKGRKLNKQMLYLNGVLEDELQGKVLWLPTADMLGGSAESYRDTAPYQGKNERMRSKDGIHFTPKGQKYLAEHIAEHIRFEP
ncbi:MAG: DUF459 domain-containing protein [Neisseria sp.]|nr:DUF459 domain-containing protein [Neisseria sp.]